MLSSSKLMWKNRNRLLFRFNYCLILFILLLIFCLLLNQRLKKIKFNLHQVDEPTDVHLFIDHIRDTAIIDQKIHFNILYNITSEDIPKWLNQYGITQFFNFYWLQNGGYLWHLQRSINLKQDYNNPKRSFQQTIPDNFHSINLFNYLQFHPEYGILLDTASDPIQPLFPLLPQSSSSFEQLCQQYQWLIHWYPCIARSEMILSITSSSTPSPLITYALYDVTINTQVSPLKMIHYDELIYLFDSQYHFTNETSFVRQILPRLIRLLALVPRTSLILLPYLNSKVFIYPYIDIFIVRGIIPDRKRFLEYNSNQIYHTNILYSTSSPRSDLILLNKILIGNKSSIRRDLILIIRNNLDDYSYNEIVQTINQFELPEDYSYLRIQEYREEFYNLTQIQDLFQRARIIISMPTDILSHIVWCLPRTHIIEIIDKKITTDFYEISLQLGFHYWLVKTTKTNFIDGIDFRNLMMQVLINIDA